MKFGLKLASLVLVAALLATTVVAAGPDFNPGTGTADVAVMNTTTSSATVTAEYVNQGGTVERTIPKTVPGKGTVDFLAADSGLGEGWVGSMVLSSTAEIASVARVTWTGGSSADGKVSGTYSGVPAGATTMYCAALYQRPGKQYSVLTVQNTDTGTATIEIYYYDRNGTGYSGNPITDTIPQSAQRSYDLSTPGGKVPSLPIVNPPGDGWIGSVKVVAQGGKKIAAVVTTHWPDYSSIDNCASTGYTSLYFPDIKRRVAGSAWKQFGGAVIQNLGSSTANVTATWMDRDGNTLHTFTDTIPPLASHGYNTRYNADTPDPAALFAALGDDRNGALRITSNQPLAGVYNGQTVEGFLAGTTYSGDGAGGMALYFPAVYRQVSGSNWIKFTALLVYNPSETQAANVTVKWYATNGTELYSFTDSIPAKSSHGYNTRYAAGTNTPDPNALFAALGDNYRGGVSITSNIPVLGSSNIIEPAVDTDAYNAYAQQ